MRYLRATWFHNFPAEPIELLSEWDENRWEVRKIERFRDGSLGWADGVRSSAETRLGLEPVPSVQEINTDPEFQANETSAEEFESAWVNT